jgi:hypothetical protein
MIWVTLLFIAFCAFIVYTDATVETVFAFIQTVMLAALVIGFIAGLFYPR